MSNFEINKEKITDYVLQLLREELPPQNWYPESWWKNIRKGGGLALTSIGNFAFESSGLEHWDKEIPKFHSLSEQEVYLLLDRKLRCPYYLFRKGKNIVLRVWDSRIAITLTLWDNIEDLLKSLENRKNISSFQKIK